MAKKGSKYPGVYKVEGKTRISYGIDYVHPLTGKRIQKILKKVTTEAEAFTLRSIEIADAARGATDKAYGLKSKIKTVPFSSMADDYVDFCKDNKKSWNTEFYRVLSLKRAFNGKLMSDINPFVIEKYKSLRSKQVTRSTVNKELITGKQIFEKAIDWNKYNGDNPFLKVQKYKITKGKKPGYLTPDQVKALMDNIKHSVIRDMVEYDFNTGWRISEIRKLKRSEVNLETGRAWIADPKNGQSVEIELNDQALSIIARQPAYNEYVFSHKNGEPFKTNMCNTIKRAAQKAGIKLPPRKAWHILRRTWASMMLQNGCDLETLRQLGNWKDYSMPMWYADAGDTKHKKTFLNRIPKLNGRKKGEIQKVSFLTA